MWIAYLVDLLDIAGQDIRQRLRRPLEFIKYPQQPLCLVRQPIVEHGALFQVGIHRHTLLPQGGHLIRRLANGLGNGKGMALTLLDHIVKPRHLPGHGYERVRYVPDVAVRGFRQQGKGLRFAVWSQSLLIRSMVSPEKIEKTEWHRCVSFGKMASVIGDYLKKGRLIHVEGKLHTRKWDDKDGITRYTTEVQVRGMKMLDFKKEEDSEPCPNEKPTTSNIDADDDVPF